MPEAALSNALREAASPEARDALAGIPLEARLEEMIASARAANPGVELEERAFLAHVGARLDEEAARDGVAGLRAGDVYLCAACLAGDPTALSLFESRVLAAVTPSLARMEGMGSLVDDVKARLREKLLVQDGERAPRLSLYAGRGDLVGFVRVAAVREALDVMRQQRRGPEPDDDALLEAASPEDDPELRHLKERYRSEFKRAFEDALSQLSSKERTLLRQQLVDGLSIDELAALYGVHRATAARWVQRAKDELLSGTRRALMRDLKVGRDELESIFRLIQSQLDVSLSRLLRTGSLDAG